MSVPDIKTKLQNKMSVTLIFVLMAMNWSLCNTCQTYHQNHYGMLPQHKKKYAENVKDGDNLILILEKEQKN